MCYGVSPNDYPALDKRNNSFNILISYAVICVNIYFCFFENKSIYKFISILLLFLFIPSPEYDILKKIRFTLERRCSYEKEL